MSLRLLPAPPATTAATHTTIPASATIPVPATIPTPTGTHNPTTTVAPAMNRMPQSFDESFDEYMHQHWDSDWLLRRSLSRFPDPDIPYPRSVLEIRFRMLKVELENLEAVLAAAAPLRPPIVGGRIAVIRHYLKVLTWRLLSINKFPSEILSEIFRYALMSSRGDQQTVATRLLLTRVCRRWRHLAIGDGILWSQIVFRDPYPFTRSLTSLKRAGSIPLDIGIAEPKKPANKLGPPPMLDAQSFTYFLDQVLRRASTIRSLHLWLESWDTAIIALQKFAHVDMPLLEEFILHRLGALYGRVRPGEVQPAFKNPIILWNAPRLQSLLINGITFDWDHIASSNLTRLDLRRMTMAACPSLLQFREMLSGCPRLYRLALDASGPRWDNNPENRNLAPVDMRSLRSLFIGDQSVVYALFVLSQFTAPRIVFLALVDLKGEDYGPLIQFLHHRFPLVQVMDIMGVLVVDDSKQEKINLTRLVGWLQSMPDLTVLKIKASSSFILEAFICKILPPINNEEEAKLPTENERPFEVVCPRLKYLGFRRQRPAIIHRLTSTRKELGVTFDKVYSPVSSRALERLQEFLPQIKATVNEFVWIPDLQSIPEEDSIKKQVNQEDIAFFASLNED
ncbi:hypothetical protein NLI96_g7003 [Meripilus lineatus]|uniref:F-box domain-containing protein n=1 Tax=Meripilus lineatus TaxID=2056292 RepID=A0AAD5V1Q4_9APHY|nr:hypothetical protein NLI96_g7003 [Physisporinus lineatus]